LAGALPQGYAGLPNDVLQELLRRLALEIASMSPNLRKENCISAEVSALAQSIEKGTGLRQLCGIACSCWRIAVITHRRESKGERGGQGRCVKSRSAPLTHHGSVRQASFGPRPDARCSRPTGAASARAAFL